MPSASIVSPPVGLIAAATAALVVALALLVVDQPASHVLGYALTAVVAVGLIAAYQRVDVGRRVSPYYSPSVKLLGLQVGTAALRRLKAAVAIGAVIVAAAHTWAIATYLAV
jgi:hypothetical protein